MNPSTEHPQRRLAPTAAESAAFCAGAIIAIIAFALSVSLPPHRCDGGWKVHSETTVKPSVESCEGNGGRCADLLKSRHVVVLLCEKSGIYAVESR